MNKIRLGAHVKDVINGRTGTAYERIIWLFGCNYITMLPDTELKQELEAGTVLGIPYDEQRLVELEDTRENLVLNEESIGKQKEFFGKEATDKVTSYALFKDGNFLTNEQQNDKKFLKSVQV